MSSDCELPTANCQIGRPAARCADRRFSVRRSRSRGFTAIEFLVLLGILLILASIFVPYVLKLREENRRVVCRDHLQQIYQAMQAYAKVNGSFFPAAGTHDPALPLTVFAGDPAAANNVTASLWLLVRGDYIDNPAVFRCPSLGGPAAAANRDLPDFADPASLGYSYAAPFGLTDSFRLTDVLAADYVVLADLNPGTSAAVGKDAPLLEMAKVNSRNHRRAGQNVLYAYGQAEWQITPYCGKDNDNIYTVRGARGATQPSSQPSTDRGAVDLSILPSASDDSFLLPAAPAP